MRYDLNQEYVKKWTKGLLLKDWIRFNRFVSYAFFFAVWRGAHGVSFLDMDVGDILSYVFLVLAFTAMCRVYAYIYNIYLFIDIH